MIWFTSDLHFGHENILKYCGRPFENATDMNAGIIKLWNSRIQDNDDVYILGDVAMSTNAEKVHELVTQLKGRKHLILGNHDYFVYKKNFHAEDFVEVTPYREIKWNHRKLCLMHYPLVAWNNQRHGAIMLHGHSHNPASYNEEQRQAGLYRYDVGVDANNMTPISIEEILAFFEGSDNVKKQKYIDPRDNQETDKNIVGRNVVRAMREEYGWETTEEEIAKKVTDEETGFCEESLLSLIHEENAKEFPQSNDEEGDING